MTRNNTLQLKFDFWQEAKKPKPLIEIPQWIADLAKRAVSVVKSFINSASVLMQLQLPFMKVYELEQRIPPLLPRLKQYAMKLTKSPEKAEDLVNDMVEKALKNASKYTEKNLYGWLVIMMRRIFYNDCRKKAPILLAEISETARGMVANQGEANMLKAEIAKAFDKLPSDTKCVAEMKYLHSMTGKEIVSESGFTIKAVKKMLAEAKASLQSNLIQFR